MQTGGNAAYQAIKAGLLAYLNDPPNFEQIYHCAHELLLTFAPTGEAVDEFKPILQPFAASKPAVSQEALTSLAKRITDQIFKIISGCCSANTRSLDPFSRFIENLRSDHVLRIYTTNYDDFALQAAPDLYTDFDAAGRPGPKRFEIDRFWSTQDEAALLHLHGSVHMGFPRGAGGQIGELFWFDDRAEAVANSSFSGASGSDRRMDGTHIALSPVVTGLEKLSSLQQRPLSHFYSAMAAGAMQADVIFVAGSGLADVHLNTWLAEARSRDPRPPLLFIDWWKDGFEETYFGIDRKTV